MFTFLRNPPPEECVYNLVQQTVDDRAQGPPIYRSKYTCMVKQERLCNRRGCFKTMGIPKVCLCPPEKYLRKHSRAPISITSSVPRIKVSEKKPSDVRASGSGTQVICEKPVPVKIDSGHPPCDPDQPESTCCGPETAEEIKPCCPPPCKKNPCRQNRLCCSKKPAVPSRCVAKLNVEDAKNYIHSNIVKAKRLPPRKPAARYVFHPKGHVHGWDESGFPRKYVYRDNFGCVPDYIQCIKAELCQNDLEAKYEMKFKERDIQNQIRHLEPVEHQAILCGLKKNWEEKFAEFQALPINVDRPAIAEKKHNIEEELKALERDIQIMDRHDHIFVSDTSKSFYLA